MRILVADADEPLLEIQQSYLWRHGHDVKIACNGLDCLSILRQYRPDVMVLNSDLPWGGSEGVLQLMGNDPTLRNTPVILTTDAPESIDGRMKRSVIACHQKPYRLSTLREEIELAGPSECLSRRNEEPLPRRFETRCLQTCPVCGRRLSLPVQLLGRVATCGHCLATFQARCAEEHCDGVDPSARLYERAEELLRLADARFEPSFYGYFHASMNR